MTEKRYCPVLSFRGECADERCVAGICQLVQRPYANEPVAEKCRLRLHRVHLGLFDDIEVFDIDRRVALPFDWISTDDGEPMLEVDACYERVAAIRIVPLKHRRRKPGEPIDDL